MALLSRLMHCSLTAGLLLISGATYAETDRADYDLDNDGLIEINDLADLDEIRNNLDGTTLYGESTGCPAEGCQGFELTTDLDFDTNGDGVMDALDAYWNEGVGWDSLSKSSSNAIHFDGNGFKIRNLYISGGDYPSLFGYFSGGFIRRLHMDGPLMAISGDYGFIAALIARVDDVEITEVYTAGEIISTAQDSYVGTIAGYADSTVVQASMTASLVRCDMCNDTSGVGGVVGYERGSDFKALVVASFVSSTSQNTRAVIGRESGSGHAVDSLALGFYRGSGFQMQQQVLAGEFMGVRPVNNHILNLAVSLPELSSPEIRPLLELQCPISADNYDCGEPLYVGWEAYLNLEGQPLWDFGSADQLPGLNIMGRVYRDSDGDGRLDVDDVFPNNYAISLDRDEDGAPDAIYPGCDVDCQKRLEVTWDAFPNHPQAYLDADWDGMPDAWSVGCDKACQLNSGLVLDPSIDDFDNDFIKDALDSDDDNNGVPDADQDSDGLVDINSLAQLSAMRFNLQGHGRVMVEAGFIDYSGCPAVFYDGQLNRQCHGYELLDDLDFDTNSDGVIGEEDEFWNEGAGWHPIGELTEPFSAKFIGNGHHIRNLYIDKTIGQDVEPKLGPFLLEAGAFFNVIASSHVSEVIFDGPLVQVKGAGFLAAGVVGFAESSTISDLIFVGKVANAQEGEPFSAGIVGFYSNLTLNNVAAWGEVSNGYAAGLIAIHSGLFYDSIESKISNSFSVMKTSGYSASMLGSVSVRNSSKISVTNVFNAGVTDHFVGQASDQNGLMRNDGGIAPIVKASYWASDITGQIASTGSDASNAQLLTSLKCPTQANDSTCSDILLYENWGEQWDFGTSDQLPGLIINGKVYRYSDIDGDGLYDEADPDIDNDGYANDIDAFPRDSREHLDTDGDGIGNNNDIDDDNDMITDVWEEAYGFDPLDPADANLDVDNDGASNLDEFESGSDPHDADSVPAWVQGGGAWKYYLYKKAS